MSAAPTRVALEASWKEALSDEFGKAYMRRLKAFLVAEKRARRVVYPKGADIFAALDLTPIDTARVVIIGQDPYHGPGQAHGLCFSVPPGVARPPSLANIIQEIESDLADGSVPGGRAGGAVPAGAGCLVPWARQGVVLLNAVLTVSRGRANSHQGHGWEEFTDRVVATLNERCRALVFLLWGSYAQRKGAAVDTGRHLVLKAPHPSPLSAHRGFFGCRHFSQANAHLVANGFDPIDWFAVE